MTDTPDLAPLQARLPDTSNLPTTQIFCQMLAVIYLLAALAYVTYGLRMYSRITSKQLGLEDWLMTAAMMFSIPLVALQYFYFKYNDIGLSLSEMQWMKEKSVYALFSTWLNQVLYSPILGLVKASTLVFMLRIAGHVRKIKLTIYVINTINIAMTISQIVATIFITIPVASYWNQTKPKHRLDTAALNTSMCTFTIITDILVLSIPFWVFIRTKLPRATRCGVIMVFMTGGLVTVIGIIKVCVFTESFYEPGHDRFQAGWGPALNAIESCLAITTACLPTLSPLLRTWFPRLFRNLRRGGTQQRPYYEEGGSSKDTTVKMQDFSQQHPSARSVSNSTSESQEGFFGPAAIQKTTDIRVAYSERSITGQHWGEAGRADGPRPSDPALAV